MMKLPARDGFTLIELVIVMIIIGVLAALAAPKLWGSKDRAYESSVQSDLRSAVTAQEVYHGRNLTYASTFADLGLEISAGVTVVITQGTPQGWAATASHPSMGARECGVRFGDAPLSAAPMAEGLGLVQCDAP